MNATGDFVIAWHSNPQDGSGHGVYAQRYNAAGVPQGGEFPVNTFTAGNQYSPSVAMDASGDFVIAWVRYGQDYSSNIYAQRFNAAGVPQGGELQVNSFPTFQVRAPAVAMDADGDFVITWNGYGDSSSYGVCAQRYDVAGVPQGGQFLVNPLIHSGQPGPTAAMDADGEFVITWSSFTQDGSGDGIYAQRFGVVAPGPTVDTGGPYSAVAGAAVTLDRAFVSPPAGDYTYSWDLDNDGVFGETGLAATRGHETGLTPTFSAAELSAPSSVPVTFRVFDGTGNVDTATTINIITGSPVLVIDDFDAPGPTGSISFSGDWATGGGTVPGIGQIGRNANVHLAHGESFLPNVDWRGRRRA
jgi:hypothetical protein